MRASFYGRLGTFALLGALMVQSTPAFAWGYGHGMLQVSPGTGNVSGLDVPVAANTQVAYNAGERTNVKVQESEQTQTATATQVSTPVVYAYNNIDVSGPYNGSYNPSVAVLSR
jgi:hypothetical protein